jgi:hypothetical protein
MHPQTFIYGHIILNFRYNVHIIHIFNQGPLSFLPHPLALWPLYIAQKKKIKITKDL